MKEEEEEGREEGQEEEEEELHFGELGGKAENVINIVYTTSLPFLTHVIHTLSSTSGF